MNFIKYQWLAWLQNNNREIYLTHNEGKSVVTEIFVGTLKNKICNHLTVESKNVYNDKLDDIVNNYDNTYRIIKMKFIDVKLKYIYWLGCLK